MKPLKFEINRYEVHCGYVKVVLDNGTTFRRSYLANPLTEGDVDEIMEAAAGKAVQELLREIRKAEARK